MPRTFLLRLCTYSIVQISAGLPGEDAANLRGGNKSGFRAGVKVSKSVAYGMAEEVAEKVFAPANCDPQALKRESIFSD